MNTKIKIGIFDSGIGGITVLKEIIKILPNEQYVYYSDSKNNPYGDKPKEEIKKICDKICRHLLQKGCNVIVIACNTASAVSAKYLRNKYKDIPIIAIEPAYKMVHDYAPNGRTLVMATKGTIKSEKFNLLFKKYNNHKTKLLACSGLADIIEEGNNQKVEKYLEEEIGSLKGKIDNVVLGCTHYPLVQNEIAKILGNVKFFNGATGLAIHLKDVLKENNLLENEVVEKNILEKESPKKNEILENIQMKNDTKIKIEFEDSSKDKKKEQRFFDLLSVKFRKNI